MDKNNCDIIEDLLPLYIEDMVSEQSSKLIEEHLAVCAACREKLHQLKTEIPIVLMEEQEKLDELKQFRHHMRKHMAAVAAIGAFVGIAAVILIWGLLFLRPGDEMGYTLLTFYLILPTTAFLCSLITAMKQTRVKWLLPVVFGGIGCVLPFIIYKDSLWDSFALFFAAIPSLLGLVIGLIVSGCNRKRKNRRKK